MHLGEDEIVFPVGADDELGEVVVNDLSLGVAAADGDGLFELVIDVPRDGLVAVVLGVGDDEEAGDQIGGLVARDPALGEVRLVPRFQHGVHVPERKDGERVGQREDLPHEKQQVQRLEEGRGRFPRAPFRRGRRHGHKAPLRFGQFGRRLQFARFVAEFQLDGVDRFQSGGGGLEELALFRGRCLGECGAYLVVNAFEAAFEEAAQRRQVVAPVDERTAA